ncbi:MAG TPA: hypothetical protein VG425_17240 [Casimicrobiaceae bacterium]|jgi:hypothetical protein|nr:hypothetical protein [Casimicrobiaceae bacterium]
MSGWENRIRRDTVVLLDEHEDHLAADLVRDPGPRLLVYFAFWRNVFGISDNVNNAFGSLTAAGPLLGRLEWPLGRARVSE